MVPRELQRVIVVQCIEYNTRGKQRGCAAEVRHFSPEAALQEGTDGGGYSEPHRLSLEGKEKT